jgi:amino acid transporter
MDTHATNPAETSAAPQLRRTLNLPLLVLYGLGTTIGAGIYVLVGAAAGRAGLFAPLAFVLAAIAVAPTAAAYGELAGRFPVSAGEASYVREGLRHRYLSLLTGLLVILSGVVATATISIGCAGYISSLVSIPLPVAVVAVIIAMGLVAMWGILESVLLAALFTIIEAGGLIALIVAGFFGSQGNLAAAEMDLPAFSDTALWLGIANAGILAIFAFIGFEDMVNVAEETRNPKTTMPWAILLTLGITAVLYTLVTYVAVNTIAPEDLARSSAPLSDVFQARTGLTPVVISAIAIFATLNTVLVQIIMASRVIYGMAGQGTMPAMFNQVSALTHTPTRATIAIVMISLVLALAYNLEGLAEATSLAILIIWVLANAALIAIKLRREPAPEGVFVVPMIVPVLGLLLSLVFIAVSLFA